MPTPAVTGMAAAQGEAHGCAVVVPASEATQLLGDWQAGNEWAGDRLITLIYPDLCRLANRQLSGMAQMTLQPTASVHEVWLKLNRHVAPNCGSRAHFMSLAARVVRQIAIDHAKRRSAGKRDGGTTSQCHSGQGPERHARGR